MGRSYDVAVLGAGPAGLGAAYRLARAGRSVVVCERAGHVGGLAASFDVAGVRVDHGSHRLHPSIDPAILATLRDRLGDELQAQVRHGRMLLAGRLVGFPPRPPELLRALPPALSARLARDAGSRTARRAAARLGVGPRPTDGADTFAAVVRARLGPTLLDAFYDPYVRKIWGLAPDALSGELARRRVGASSGSLLRRVLARPATAGFLYPRDGFGSIPEVLADAAVESGAEVRLATAVERVAVRPDGVTVHTAAGPVEAGQVWSTIPVPALARLVEPHAPGAVRAAAASLRFRALVLLYLVLDRPAWTEYDAHYFPDPSVPASRVSEPKRYRDRPDDPRDRTVLCAELPCSVGDATWTAAPDVLAASLADALDRAGLPDATPSAVEVRRVAHAYPVYDHEHGPAFAVVDAWVGTLPRVLTFGRQGLFAHDNTHHALATAWAAADALGADGAVDRRAWSVARDRFRTHVVED